MRFLRLAKRCVIADIVKDEGRPQTTVGCAKVKETKPSADRTRATSVGAMSIEHEHFNVSTHLSVQCVPLSSCDDYPTGRTDVTSLPIGT